MAYVPLARLHELYDGYRQPIRLAGQELLLLQDEGRLVLLANRCPHRQAPLSNANIAAGVLRCPQHGIEFSLRSGQALNEAGCAALQFFPLIYEGNTVGVEVAP
ncbi:Rieske (2Fe-2S) protein [Gilvimarinus sp. DA14]|uniref:Rieske (2Fe-2S) protein n=1 Tax=Gilvimarinus sp. DA14 TaxID=2956798 RepID=UPI0020B7B6BF|nr:Rieske (2Fe-2S) protein [Gilvimarinus sp. DA14]UTF60364.1 Rieske (2Fe-2S) protein [Gilvimarinus sp. DA14]